MNFPEILYNLRKKNKLSQKELADKLGVAQASVNYWEKGQRSPSINVIKKIADYFKVSTEYLIGFDQSDSKSIAENPVHTNNKRHIINVLGRVAAGFPIEAIEHIIDTEEISEDMAKTGEYFGLQIHGDSMEPRMYEGDVVIVRQQDDAESGDIVIAMVNGNDATCKRLTKYAGGIALSSLNNKYEPMMFSNDEIINKPVKIIGKVVELRGKL